MNIRTSLIIVALISLSLVVAQDIHAATTKTNVQVMQVSWYSNSGIGFIKLNAAVGEPGCSTNLNVQFDKNDVGFEQFIKIGLAAQLAGRNVDVKTSGCSGAYPNLYYIGMK